MPKVRIESDSDVYSYDYDSDSEFEDVEDVLRSLNYKKKYWKLFKKAKIIELSDIKSITDSKLKKIGISSSSHRKKLLKTVEDLESESEYDYDSDSDSSQESEDEEDRLNNLLEKKGLKKIVKIFKKNRIRSVEEASKLSSKKLKKMGIESSRTQKQLLSVLSKEKKSKSGDESDSSVSSGSGDSLEKKIIFKILKDNGFESLEVVFLEHDMINFDKVESLTDDVEALRAMGLFRHNIRVRLNQMFSSENLSKYKAKGKKGLKEKKEDPLCVALKRVGMQKHLSALRSHGVKSVREAQEMDDEKLSRLGISNEGQRALIMECMVEADWRCFHCNAWNENRKTCLVCQKTHRIVKIEKGSTVFEIGDLIKYTGKARPLTKTYSGAKGEIHRVLDGGKFYMVKFFKNDGKIIKIRLSKEELKKRKK